jgi:MFS family permease
MLSTTAEPRTGRRTLSPRLAYGHVAAVIGLALFASSTPAPLWGTYSELWGFSPVVLTLIYATYAIGVLTALLMAGRLSDEAGRRPVLIVALAALMGASVLFALADSVAWLFAARAVQGVATGLVLSAASAALLDLHPRRDPAGVGLANGVVSAGGLGLGALVSSVIVQELPAPRVLPYLLLFGLFAVAFAGALAMPEPVARTGRPRLTPQRPSIPEPVRRPFILAALAVFSSWSIGGLFLSLGPTLSASLFHTQDHEVAGLAVFALAGTAAAAQLVFGRAAPWLGATAGSLALAAGVMMIVAAAATGSGGLYWAGAIIGGAGFGVDFLSGLRSLSAAIPPEHRAQVMSAFYVVAYGSLSIPAILAGVLVTPLGLDATFELFGSVVAGLALLVAFEAWRTRPRVHGRPALAMH